MVLKMQSSVGALCYIISKFEVGLFDTLRGRTPECFTLIKKYGIHLHARDTIKPGWRTNPPN